MLTPRGAQVLLPSGGGPWHTACKSNAGGRFDSNSRMRWDDGNPDAGAPIGRALRSHRDRDDRHGASEGNSKAPREFGAVLGSEGAPPGRSHQPPRGRGSHAVESASPGGSPTRTSAG